MNLFEKFKIIMLFTILGIDFLIVIAVLLGIGSFKQKININNNSCLRIDSVLVRSKDGDKKFRAVIKQGAFKQMYIPEAADEDNDSLDVTVFIDSEALSTRIYSHDTIIVLPNQRLIVK